MPLVATHPFFRIYSFECTALMKQVCHCCIWQITLSKGDVAFNAGEVMPHPGMLFIASGKLVYTRAAAAHAKPELVKEGMWAAEPVMWTEWTFAGMLRAKTNVASAMIEATGFQETVAKSPLFAAFAIEYAKSFTDALSNTPDQDLTDLCDYHMDLDRLARAAIYGDADFDNGINRNSSVRLSTASARHSTKARQSVINRLSGLSARVTQMFGGRKSQHPGVFGEGKTAKVSIWPSEEDGRPGGRSVHHPPGIEESEDQNDDIE